MQPRRRKRISAACAPGLMVLCALSVLGAPLCAWPAQAASVTDLVIDTSTNTVVDTLTWPNPTDVATMPLPDSATALNIASCGASAFAQGFIGNFPQQGAATGQMRQFLGVPYAAAPTGANRWNPPQPFCWDGTRQFTAFGNHGGKRVLNMSNSMAFSLP
jgi:Carboxylesterase family